MTDSDLNTVTARAHISPLDRLIHAQFKAAAEEAVVDLSVIGNNPLKGMPSALTTDAYVEYNYGLDADPQFTMELMEDGECFAVITSRLGIRNAKVMLYDMTYGTGIKKGIKGFAPYAVRHLVSALRDMHNVVIATGIMAKRERIDSIQDDNDRALVERMEHGKLKMFEWLGFQLRDAKTNERIYAPDNAADLKACRAEFPFDDQETRDAVFKTLGLAADKREATVIELPVRHAHEVPEHIRQIAVAHG
ncbi:MAG: hypothetical protein SFW65_07230 [Alphaproteobacteria bacterium]|nr:hypothetical protein [Alphaproteobacteria bacterium]